MAARYSSICLSCSLASSAFCLMTCRRACLSWASTRHLFSWSSSCIWFRASRSLASAPSSSSTSSTLTGLGCRLASVSDRVGPSRSVVTSDGRPGQDGASCSFRGGSYDRFAPTRGWRIPVVVGGPSGAGGHWLRNLWCDGVPTDGANCGVTPGLSPPLRIVEGETEGLP